MSFNNLPGRRGGWWRCAIALAIAAAASCAPRTAPVASRQASISKPAVAAATPTTKPVAAKPAPTGAIAQALTEKQYLEQATQLREIYSRPATEWPKPNLDPTVAQREIGKLPEPEFPADNAFSKEKEALGRTLFFDPRLSGSGQIACASCHDPDLAWADGRTVSFGHSRTPLKRNAPSILFAAYNKPLFWDGRADTLEDQFHNPVESAVEMNARADVIVQRLDAVPEYRQQFKDVFGADHVTMGDAARAVATFERSLAKLAGRSKFDKFMAGDTKALSDAQVRGLHLFRTSARCMNCHSGPTFTDNQFHDLGLSYYGRKFEDRGRYEVTKDPKDVGRFRTPTLRNVERTAPYMHTGMFNLKGTVAAYNTGMATLTPTTMQKSDPLFPRKDPLLKRLGLGSLEMEDLTEFLKSLSEPPLRIRPPELPGMNKATVAAEPTEPVKAQ